MPKCLSCSLIEKDIATEFESASSGAIEPPESDYRYEIYDLTISGVKRGIEVDEQDLKDMDLSTVTDTELSAYAIKINEQKKIKGICHIQITLIERRPCGHSAATFEHVHL